MSDVSSLQPGWERRRVKQLAKRFYSGGTPDSGNQSFYSQDGTGTPWLMISDMSQVKYVLSTRKRVTSSGKASRRLEVLPQGTVLYAMYASVGAVSMLGIDATVNQAILGIETRKDIALPQFLAYALEDRRRDVLQVASTSTQANLSAQKVKDLEVVLPPLEVQGSIVRYLDHAELRIAKAIAAKQTMVSLMEEQRSAVVAHEMLGGENKRTAVKQLEGFGEIPAHWEVMTLRGLLRKIALRNPGGHQLLSVLRSRGVIERSLDRADNHNFIPDDLSNYKVVKPGDLVMNKMKAWSGSVGVSRHRGVVSPAYFVYEFRSPIDPAFMNLLFRSNYMRYWFGRYSEGVRVGQWDLSPEEIKNIRVPVPALEEQVAISERVVARTSEMDAAIASVQAEIALLKEYRTRLISDVVTGKLDVRDEAAKLPEIDPMELATVAVGENGDDEEATDDD